MKRLKQTPSIVEFAVLCLFKKLILKCVYIERVNTDSCLGKTTPMDKSLEDCWHLI